MRTVSLTDNNLSGLDIFDRKVIESQIINKLFLVRSFIDQKRKELDARAKSENNLDILNMIREVRLIDEEWSRWSDKTLSDLQHPESDTELIKYRVHHEMNQMLDKIEKYDN